MSRILVLYTSIDGQTARIARHVASTLGRLGHAVTVRASDAVEVVWEIGTHDAVIVGGAVRFGRVVKPLEALVSDRVTEIQTRPNAFFSVCLSAGGPGAKPENARKYQQDFFDRTDWYPELTASFAGALLYTKYNPVIRTIMRLILTIARGDTDTTRDYDYTDWNAVERFAEQFASRIALPRAA